MNLLNELKKSYKLRGMPGILSLFRCNEFNKLNYTGARMLDTVYHLISLFGIKTLRFLHYVRDVVF